MWEQKQIGSLNPRAGNTLQGPGTGPWRAWAKISPSLALRSAARACESQVPVVQFIEIFSEPHTGLENEAGEHPGGPGRV